MTARVDERRFEELLHAYELGMLSEAEEEEFEILLMENADYFERFQQLEAASLLLTRTAEARESIRRIVDKYREPEFVPDSEKRRISPRRRFWPGFVPPALAAAAVLFIVILANWQIEIKPTPEATAAANRLAVIYFDNIAEVDDPSRLGEIAANLLITDLSESRFINVVSGQRLYDILKLLGKEGLKIVDRETATEIAREAHARWMLTGSILQVTPQLVLTSQLIDVESGDVIAAQRVTGDIDDNIFTVVDHLSADVKHNLPLPAAAQREPDRMVAEVTTRSPEAYRFYLEGIEYFEKLYRPEATERFASALEYDSTFAMAYYYLSQLRDAKFIARAMQYIDKAGEKDQIAIRVRQASLVGDVQLAIAELQRAVRRFPDEKEFHYLLGTYMYSRQDYPAAIDHCREAIEIDPLYKVAYNMLAYAYFRNNEFENAILAIDEYIALAPGEANPYDSRGEIYAQSGRFELAIESYEKALRIKPDFYSSLTQLGHLYLFQQQYAKADSCYRLLTVASEPMIRSRARYFRALVPMFQGRLNEALEALDDGLAADSIEYHDNGYPVDTYTKHLVKADIYAAQKMTDSAIVETERTIAILNTFRPEDKDTYRCFLGQRLAEAGRIEDARRLAREQKELAIAEGRRLDTYWHIIGSMELVQGDPDAAVSAYELATAENPRFPPHYLLARAYLKAGRLNDAIAEFEHQLSIYETDLHLSMGIWWIKARYYLGLAYETAERPEDAVRQYQVFLDFWNNADPGIEEIKDARARLSALQAST